MVRIGICDDEMMLLEKLNQFVQMCYARNQIFARVATFKGWAWVRPVPRAQIIAAGV